MYPAQAAPVDNRTWNFEVPPPHKRGKNLQLLTIGRVSVAGKWQGGLGEYFVAWTDQIAIPEVCRAC